MFRMIAIILLMITFTALSGPIYDSLRVDNLNLDANTISSLDTNGNITLSPNGNGGIVLKSGTAIVEVLDEDTLVSDSATALATQQSIKAYVDALTVPVAFTTVTKTTTATLATTNEDNVLVDATTADFTVTLPTAAGNSGLTYKITKSTAANTVTIDGNGAQTIGGELSIDLNSKDDSIIITSDGSNWYLLSDDIQYHAHYTSNAGQAISNNTLTTVVYEDLESNTHPGSYNTTTGVYTFQADGNYIVNAMVLYTTDLVFTTTIVDLGIYVNGTEITTKRTSALVAGTSFRHNRSVSEIISVSKNDTLEIKTFQNSGVAKSLDSTSTNYITFSVARIK